jgi:hypothetical protein
MKNQNAKKNKQQGDNMIVHPTHVVVKPNFHNNSTTTFNVSLDTVDSSTKAVLNKDTTQLEVTGTYGFWPSPSIAGNITSAIWQALVSFGGRMDVVVSLTDKIAISLNNPTFGYPYTVFVDSDSTFGANRHNYYEDESYTYVDTKGRRYTCLRNRDTNNKEFTITIMD